MKRGSWALVALVVSCLLPRAGVALADDWARFRGPNGTGIAETPFDHPIDEGNFLWKVELPGAGHSCPVVYKDRLYVTTADPQTARRVVLCLDAKDGKTLWKQAFQSKAFRQHNDNSYASSTPAVDEVGVYVAYSTPQSLTLLALDHDGKSLWKQDLGPFVSQWGSGASPMVVDGLVVMTNDQEGPVSTVAAFDHKTGEQRWKIDRKTSNKTALSTPCVFQPKGGEAQLILSSKGSGVTSVNPKTGKLNWEVPDACPSRAIGSPVVTDELVIATSGDGDTKRDLTAVRPGPRSPDGTYRPTVAYKMAKTCPYVPTSIVKGDRLYEWADNGLVTCANVATGEPIWTGRAPGTYYGSPVLAGNTLWAMSRQGKLVGVSAGEAFKIVSETDLGETSQATPAIAGGRMYLRTVSHLICVGPEKK